MKILLCSIFLSVFVTSCGDLLKERKKAPDNASFFGEEEPQKKNEDFFGITK